MHKSILFSNNSMQEGMSSALRQTGKENKMLYVYLKVFLTGGIICALVQLLMDKTKMMPGRIMVLLVCTGAVLGMLGIYKPVVDYGQAGATVPLLGFGYNLWNGVRQAIDSQGFYGIFTGGFQASAAGLCGSLIFSFLASLICSSRIKK